MRMNEINKKKAFRASAAVLALSVVLFGTPIGVLAAEGGATVVTNNFKSFYDIVAALASAVGSILLLWNVVEWGITLNSQEGMMQARAFKGIGGALVMILAPQIISGFVF